MDDLGTDIKKETNEYLAFESICHCSNSHKLWYYTETHTFHCWSSCGNLSLFDVIMNVKGITFEKSIDYVLDIVGRKFVPRRGINRNKPKIMTLDEVVIEELEAVQKQYLYKIFEEVPIESWVKEGISFETQKKFNIRYDPNRNRVIIPVFDNKKCIGIRVRNLNYLDMIKYGKYIPLFYNGECYNFPTSKILYGLDVNINVIQKYKKIILVEGEKSVLKNSEYYPNGNCCVAMMGSILSRQQKKKILDISNGDKSFEVILAMDKEFNDYGDNDCNDYIKKIVGNLQELNEYCKCSYLIDKSGYLDVKDSPLDKGKDVFKCMIDNRVFIN